MGKIALSEVKGCNQKDFSKWEGQKKSPQCPPEQARDIEAINDSPEQAAIACGLLQSYLPGNSKGHRPLDKTPEEDAPDLPWGRRSDIICHIDCTASDNIACHVA